MALGQTYNNNEKEMYRPTVYGYSMSNTSDEAIDTTNLSFSMWKSTLKIAIAPKVNGGNADFTEWDRKNAAVIYLNHSKAYMMAQIIRGFMENPKEYNNCGVSAGQGLLTISTGKEYSKTETPCLIIRKVLEDGKVDSSYAYQFKQDYHSYINNFDEKSGKFNVNTDKFKSLELLEVVEQLESYSEAMTGSLAFSVVDNLAFTHNMFNNHLAKIAEGVGVQLRSGSSNKGYNNSYFAKGNQSTGGHRTEETVIDDIDALS